MTYLTIGALFFAGSVLLWVTYEAILEVLS